MFGNSFIQNLTFELLGNTETGSRKKFNFLFPGREFGEVRKPKSLLKVVKR